MNFGQFIKARRIELRLTLREFCRKIGIDPSNWSKVERGVIPPPSDETLTNKIVSTLSFNTDQVTEMTDYAALARKQLPEDLLQDKEILARMPAFFRAIRGQEYDENDLKEMIEGVRKLHQL